MNVHEVRNFFTYLKEGKIYFNHATVGPLSRKVTQAINNFIEERSNSSINNFDTFLETSKAAKIKLAQMLNTTPDRIAWTDNVSNGMSLLAQGIEWQTGDRIILNNIEFPANVYPFMNLKQYGVEIDFVNSNDGKIEISEIENLITPKTKLISISLVQFLTGFRSDITEIGKLCRKHNLIFSVDAIQGAGAVQIDVQKSNVDYLAGGGHKWLMGLQGTSYIYVTEELQKRLQQKSVGWTSVTDAWNFLDYDLTPKPTAERYQNGTLNAIGITALNASLEMFCNFGFDKVEENILNNSEYMIESLMEIGIKPVLKNTDKKNLSGIVSFISENNKFIFDELKKREIEISCRDRYVRFSPHFYNIKDEIDAVIYELKDILQR